MNIYFYKIIFYMKKEDADLLRRIERGERDIREGRYVVADTRMSCKEIDEILMGRSKSIEHKKGVCR